jgi:tetratricopeptide (TPR) repeat protein
MRALLALLLLLLLAPARGLAAEDVDPLGLAALMVQDGHWDRAAAVLAEVDPGDEGLDRARYYTLLGLVHQQQGDYRAAADAFNLATAEPGVDPLVHLYLAQALLRTGQPEGALDALDAAGPPAAELPAAAILRANAWRMLGDLEQAWLALEAGLERSPESRDLAWQQVLLLIELELYQEARERGTALLSSEQAGTERAGPGEWLAIAESLRAAGQLETAAATLEEAALRFPAERDVLVQLARVYLEGGLPLAAGELLQRAAELDEALYVEAAECYREAGRFDRALYMNAMVPDPAEKTRQRLGLLIEHGDYDRAVALSSRLERLGLLADDQVAYGLAYAWFRVGAYDACEALLKRISDPQLFQHAGTLRQAIAACRESEWGCE